MFKNDSDIIHHLKKTGVLYTRTEFVSSNSLTGYVSVYTAKGNKIANITHFIGELLGEKTVYKNMYGLKRGGYGYSKSFDVVYNIGRKMFPKGYKCRGDKCVSNDHFNDRDCDRVAGKWTHRESGYYFEEIKL